MKETMEQQPQMGGPGATGGAGGATREGSEADEEVPADFREGEQGAGLASSLVLVTQPPLTQHSASAPFCPTNILVEAAPHPLPAGSAGTTGSQQPYGAIGGASLSPGKGLLVGGREHKRGSSPPEANGPTALLVSGASGGDAEKLPTFGSSATSVLEQRRQREKGESAGASGCHLYCAESGLTEQPGNACIEQLPPRGQGGLKAGSCHGAAANAGGILCHRLVATHPVAPIMCAERGRSTARGGTWPTALPLPPPPPFCFVPKPSGLQQSAQVGSLNPLFDLGGWYLFPTKRKARCECESATCRRRPLFWIPWRCCYRGRRRKCSHLRRQGGSRASIKAQREEERPLQESAGSQPVITRCNAGPRSRVSYRAGEEFRGKERRIKDL